MPLVQSVGVASIAALSSFSTSVAIVLSRKWHGHYSLDSDLKGVQKFHTSAVPRIGGAAIFTGIIAALLFCQLSESPLSQVIHADDALLLMLAGIPAFLAGFLEDVTKKITPRFRLIATFASALLGSYFLGATLDGIDIIWVDDLFAYAPVAIILTAIMVAGGANAINIIDGFNGVASSAVIIMQGAFAYLAWGVGDVFVAQLALLGMFAAIGFFLVNYPTGRIFMGDGGAYFMGFWVSEVAILLLIRNPEINAWQVLAIVAYPIIEVLFSIYRKKYIRGMSVSMPDRVHLHMLIYRRIACLMIRPDKERPWIRNAFVACILSVWIAEMSILAIWLGHNIWFAISIVLLQVWLYVVIYKRLVCMHWYLYPEIAPRDR